MIIFEEKVDVSWVNAGGDIWEVTEGEDENESENESENEDKNEETYEGNDKDKSEDIGDDSNKLATGLDTNKLVFSSMTSWLSLSLAVLFTIKLKL